VIEERSADSGGLAAYVQGAIDSGQSLVGRYVDLSRFNVREWVLTRAREIGAFLVAGGVTVLGGLTSFLINAAISLFTLYFVFREGKALRRRIAAVLPLTSAQVDKLLNGIESTIVGTVYGGLVVAAVQGAMVGIMMWALGIASPVLWGVVAAFFALLPLVGTAAVWVPAALYLLATGSWVKALILVGWCAGVVGLIDNFLRPLLIRGRVEMHTLLVFFAVFGGVNVFGFLGLIVGPVIVAVTTTLLGLLRDEGRAWATAIREAEVAPAPDT
jgi:predicted PurR-regulated permease PerM